MQSLIEKGYELVSGGTDNHLVLVNLKNKVKGHVLSTVTIRLLIQVFVFLLPSGVCVYAVLRAKITNIKTV